MLQHVFYLGKENSILIFIALHWLPIKQIINYKIQLLTNLTQITCCDVTKKVFLLSAGSGLTTRYMHKLLCGMAIEDCHHIFQNIMLKN